MREGSPRPRPLASLAGMETRWGCRGATEGRGGSVLGSRHRGSPQRGHCRYRMGGRRLGLSSGETGVSSHAEGRSQLM